MSNKLKLFTGAFVATLTFVLFSCDKQDEESPSVISVYNVGVTDHYLHADAGSALSLEVKLSDNKSLKQVKIEIYRATTVHSHSTEIAAFTPPQLGAWDTVFVKNISDTQYSGTFVFNVPDTISGSWMVTVSALDEEGNISFEDSDLMVHNPHIPLVLVQSTTPIVSSNGIIQIQQGNTLQLTGNVVDLDTLDYVRVSLIKSSDTTWTTIWQPVETWTFDLNQVLFPLFDQVGTFKCVIEATDLSGRYHYASATIKVEQ